MKKIMNFDKYIKENISKTSENVYFVGEDIRVIATGDTAKIQDIDSDNHKVTIVTRNGETDTISITLIEPLEK
jgi:hypothetical protein